MGRNARIKKERRSLRKEVEMKTIKNADLITDLITRNSKRPFHEKHPMDRMQIFGRQGRFVEYAKKQN